MLKKRLLLSVDAQPPQQNVTIQLPPEILQQILQYTQNQQGVQASPIATPPIQEDTLAPDVLTTEFSNENYTDDVAPLQDPTIAYVYKRDPEDIIRGSQENLEEAAKEMCDYWRSNEEGSKVVKISLFGISGKLYMITVAILLLIFYVFKDITIPSIDNISSFFSSISILISDVVFNLVKAVFLFIFAVIIGLIILPMILKHRIGKRRCIDIEKKRILAAAKYAPRL